MSNPFDTQVGGSHYKQYKIQPYEFFHANQIPHHKAAIIRRILRYDHGTGKGLTDLEKIKHEVDLIIELEFNKPAIIEPEKLKGVQERLKSEFKPGSIIKTDSYCDVCESYHCGGNCYDNR